MPELSCLLLGVLAVLAQADRTGVVQLPIAVLILLSPIVCAVLFVLSLRRPVSEGRKRRLRVAVGVLPIIALGLYLFYETGVSPATNIRIDLLLIYPALLLDVLFWPALLIARLFHR